MQRGPVVVDDMAEAFSVADGFASEHVEVLTAEPRRARSRGVTQSPAPVWSVTWKVARLIVLAERAKRQTWMTQTA
jgi:hypothetical protein